MGNVCLSLCISIITAEHCGKIYYVTQISKSLKWKLRKYVCLSLYASIINKKLCGWICLVTKIKISKIFKWKLGKYLSIYVYICHKWRTLRKNVLCKTNFQQFKKKAWEMSFSVCICQKWFAVTKIKFRNFLNESLENVYLSLYI